MILLIVLTFAPLTKATLNQSTTSSGAMLVHDCSLEPGFNIWLGFQFTFAAILLVYALVLAIVTRDLPSVFNGAHCRCVMRVSFLVVCCTAESIHIMLCLFVLMLSLIILVALSFIDTTNTNAVALTRVCLFVSVLGVSLFCCAGRWSNIRRVDIGVHSVLTQGLLSQMAAAQR